LSDSFRKIPKVNNPGFGKKCRKKPKNAEKNQKMQKKTKKCRKKPKNAEKNQKMQKKFHSYILKK
jgi:hypothetical protein